MRTCGRKPASKSTCTGREQPTMRDATPMGIALMQISLRSRTSEVPGHWRERRVAPDSSDDVGNNVDAVGDSHSAAQLSGRIQFAANFVIRNRTPAHRSRRVSSCHGLAPRGSPLIVHEWRSTGDRRYPYATRRPCERPNAAAASVIGSVRDWKPRCIAGRR
jgi:hypothetical protein